MFSWLSRQIEQIRIRRALKNIRWGFAFFGMDLSDLSDGELIEQFNKSMPTFSETMKRTSVTAREFADALSSPTFSEAMKQVSMTAQEFATALSNIRRL